VIPVHDAADVIGDQMQALCAQSDVDHFEVIAVLNRCTDGSAQVIEAFADRLDMRVVTADRLASAAYARNTGAASARSHRVLFCDADDRVSPTWVRDLVNGLDVADFVGGRVLVDRDGLAEWAYRYFYADKEAGLLVREGRIPYPISASMGIRKDALSAVGGFDENFSGASGEEADLAIRLVRAGFRVGFVDGAVLRYRPRTGFRELSRQQRARAFSNSRLSLREGVEISRPSISLQALRTVRRLGRRILLERTLHPLALASDVVVNAARYRAAVWASTASEPQYDEDRDVLDVVVELGTPLIGGLAFRTDRRAVHADPVAEECRAMLLSLLRWVVGPGDSVVDLTPRVGPVTVAAARMVGPAGRVVAFESDARTGELLRSNLLRHGCQHVEVFDHVLPVPDELCGVSTGGPARHHPVEAWGTEPDLAAVLHELLRGGQTAVVVCEIGPSTCANVRRIAAECRGFGIRAWRVDTPSADRAAQVRVLDPDQTGGDGGGLDGRAGWLIGVPDARNDEMVAAVADLSSSFGDEPQVARPAGARTHRQDSAE
jgi:GT2 family glycosyltransferase